MGESLDMSISAHRSCCCACPFLCLDFEAFFSESSIFLEDGMLLMLEAVKVVVCDLVTLLAVDEGVSIVESD